MWPLERLAFVQIAFVKPFRHLVSYYLFRIIEKANGKLAQSIAFQIELLNKLEITLIVLFDQLDTCERQKLVCLRKFCAQTDNVALAT